jgi:hypothetical protein
MDIQTLAQVEQSVRLTPCFKCSSKSQEWTQLFWHEWILHPSGMMVGSVRFVVDQMNACGLRLG